MTPSGNQQLVKAAHRALVAWKVDRASDLAAHGKLEEASTVLHDAIAINDDVSLRATLEANLDHVEDAIELRHLNDLYNDAVRLANDYRYDEALAILHGIVAKTRDESLRRDASRLIGTIERFQKHDTTGKRR